jgi:hypothetical protein
MEMRDLMMMKANSGAAATSPEMMRAKMMQQMLQGNQKNQGDGALGGINSLASGYMQGQLMKRMMAGRGGGGMMPQAPMQPPMMSGVPASL